MHPRPIFLPGHRITLTEPTELDNDLGPDADRVIQPPRHEVETPAQRKAFRVQFTFWVALVSFGVWCWLHGGGRLW